MKVGDERDNSTTIQRILQYTVGTDITARFAWPTPWKLENGCEHSTEGHQDSGGQRTVLVQPRETT
jgi:hypothetical protein